MQLRDHYALPMIYVSHAIDEVVRLATEVVLIAEGRVVGAGSVEDVFSRADLRPHTGGRFEAGSVVAGTIVRHRSEWTLTDVRVGEAVMSVPEVPAPVGAMLGLRIRARDVALSLAEPVASSIGSRMPCVVTEIAVRDGPYAEVRVDIGGGIAIWALITRHSVDRLALAPGTPVHCLVKTVELDNRLVVPAPT
ncbi:MAG TPA: TOBE domain-containing protein [Casimicrobiaceae bacterium]|nr:TOBE domain-containing protein [Casimicrobiaceae bacterium]